METVSSASRIFKKCGETFFLLDPVLDIFAYLYVCCGVFFREKACEPMPLSSCELIPFTALS